MKTIAMLAQTQPISLPILDLTADTIVRRRRFPVFFLGGMMLLGVPLAIFATIAMAFIIGLH